MNSDLFVVHYPVQFVVFLSFFTCVLPAVVFLFALAHQQLQGQLYIFGICAVIAFVLSAGRLPRTVCLICCSPRLSLRLLSFANTHETASFFSRL